jgi:integrase
LGRVFATQGRGAEAIDHCRRALAVQPGWFEALDADTIADVTPDRLDDYLTGLTSSARTKNTYCGAVLGLANYLVKKDKLADNPLRRVSKRAGELKRRRRAETAASLQLILTATATRAVRQAETIRRGPRKGQLGAAVKPETRAKLDRQGRGRALWYLFAIHTGLRVSSIRKTRACDLHLDLAEPCVSLPATAMKSKRPFRQRLRADMVDALKSWLAETGRTGSDRVFDVPGAPQVSKTLKKDLAAAGVPYVDAKGRVFDAHSFRKCKGSFLRQAGVDPSVSMQQLGHADVKRTMQVYNDETLLPQDAALAATPSLTIG